VLVAAHGHPAIAKGGAEIAAWGLYEELSARPDVDAWFLGCESGEGEPHARMTQPFSDREYIYASRGFDWFRFANPDPLFPAAFRALIETIQPDVIHFHHYGRFGIEVFAIARQIRPDVRIVLTLHEYLAICAHFGQMVTRPNRHLCNEATLHACNSCFPEIDRSQFFLRKLYIQRFLREVDQFVAPSVFLKGRYVAWGLADASISVIENVVAPAGPRLAPTAVESGVFRVGFFGNISHMKGIGVLLEAARLLAEAGERRIVIEINGEYRLQPPEFQAAFLEQLGKAGSNVIHVGAYDEARVDRLMQRMDVVVVPSIWWENSPVVIQEALRNRRPVVCSDIGGMAEKVRDGVDGYHFPVGSAPALAALLVRLAAEHGRGRALRPGLWGGDAGARGEAHLAVYRGGAVACVGAADSQA
jgi:glycosyltransferase involved in cell wall biosynthesis